MTKHKIQNKSLPVRQAGKYQMSNIKTLVLSFGICALLLFCALNFGICHLSFAQQSDDVEISLDAGAKTTPLPNVFRPNVDLSGRGYHRRASWPNTLAAREVLEAWQKDIGFGGIYRMQYNLWEISQLAKDSLLQYKLLSNYENIIKAINDSGGTVILDIFGTPAGLGRALDKTSAPVDLKAFKELIKSHIRYLSCDKKYNIWYEVWSAPDLSEFFLGRRQEYLNLYRTVAEVVKELKAENNVNIPLGGPGVSWWFQSPEGNTIITPEHGLIYDLIKFCYRYHLPLNFITWHGYSTDPQAEKETTVYNKTAVGLMREWLSYFNFNKNTPLIVDEWNYDRGANVAAERKDKSNICASYILSRLKNMNEAGLDYQLYFSLEDFHSNKEGVVRNTGAFWFDAEHSEYKGGPKATYNIFKMLALLGKNMLAPVINPASDEFVGSIATKDNGSLHLLVYNYIDPDIAMNYISKAITRIDSGQRKLLLMIIKSDKLPKILSGELEIAKLRLGGKAKAILRKAKELNDKAKKLSSANRQATLNIKNLKGEYVYQKYILDASCAEECKFEPAEEKQISIADAYKEEISISPYSVTMFILKEKPRETEIIAAPPEVKQEAIEAAFMQVAGQPAEAFKENTAAEPQPAQNADKPQDAKRD